MCLIPFPFMKSENSCEVNCEPLSLTSCRGTPCRANMSQSFNLCFTGDAGHHLDLYPFRMSIDNDQEHFPMNGPAKSM